MKNLRLCINIDHIATLRQARRGIYPDPINWTKDDHRRPTSFVAYVWDEKSQSIKRITDWAKYKDGEPVAAKVTN